ncbi:MULTISPECIES: hypothetical protein [Rhodococcus]|nr:MULTISPECIES: hypothetical protein [Rhodococcus]
MALLVRSTLPPKTKDIAHCPDRTELVGFGAAKAQELGVEID